MSKQIIIRCPCCKKSITIILDNGETSDVFFNAQNQEELFENLSKFGYEFGVDRGDING